jgi:phosphomannomutase
MALDSIKFGTDGWRAVIGDGFTTSNLARVVEAVSAWLKSEHDHPSVIVGYDCRFNAAKFAETAACRLAANGVKVFISPGFVSTPMVSLATVQRQCNAGIILTASHNPPEYLGLKVKGSFGGPAHPGTIAHIESLIPEYVDPVDSSFDFWLKERRIEYYDMEALYVNYIRQRFDLASFNAYAHRLGYDAMYGAGQRVFRQLIPKAHLLHCTYNPWFDGRAPEPIESSLNEFKELVRAQGIGWGLATDGDADRIGLLSEEGIFIDSHHILLLLIYYLHNHLGNSGKIVTTFSTSCRIGLLCQLYGLPHEVTPIGFKYVGEIMSKEDVLVGGEESGGIAVKGHIPERDGIYIGLLILEMMIKLNKSLPQLINELHQLVGPFSMQRVDLKLQQREKERVMESCKNEIHSQIGNFMVNRIENVDGFKFHVGEHNWVMLRASGTEPVLRVYAEASTAAEAMDLIYQARRHWMI